MRQLKNSLLSEKFTDGIVWLYAIDRRGEIVTDTGIMFHFGEKNITAKRILDARQLQYNCDRVICTPFNGALPYKNFKCANIHGDKYRIENFQIVHTSKPPIVIFTLSAWSTRTAT